jgi:uncharacterized protein YndB with AHSA1/START domain
VKHDFSHAAVLSMLLVLAAAAVAAEEQRAVHVAEVEAGIAEVWDAFTTTAGLRRWWAPLVDVEFVVGGAIRSSYDPSGNLGDEGTIVHTILAFDPGRMIALQPTGYPDAFPFAEAMRATWTVFYLEELAPERTRITIVGLGYSDSGDSQKLRAFFEPANAELMRRLAAALQRTSGGAAGGGAG